MEGDRMKEKIIIFLVGLLLGSIISTGSIYIYTVANNKNDNDMNLQMPNDDKGQGGMMRENDKNAPLDMPNGNPSIN